VVRNAQRDQTIVIKYSSGVTVDGKTVNTGSENLAAIDTGTSLIGAPTAAVNAIWGAVSGATPLTGNMSGYYSFRKYRFRPAWRRTWQR
jgi:Eukaryotic aspartyl protease